MSYALQLSFLVCTFLTVTISHVVLPLPAEDAETEPTSSKKFGDSCEGMEYCHGELVSCQHGVCACYNPDVMIYDEFSQGCVVLAGKKCEIHSDMWKVSVTCVEGAECDDSGICICGEGYYPNSNGSCVRKKLFKESCNSDQECASLSSKSLVCIDNLCSCDKRGQIYDEKRKACVALVDSECEMEDSDSDCTSQAICRQGRCVCKPGFAKTVTQECRLGFGAECSPNNGRDCADVYFMCVNGQCACKHPIHQVFDERTQECLSLVSGPCDFPKKDFKSKNVTGIYDIQKCIKNAQCVDKGFYSECECKAGFVQTKMGTCAPGRGESCEMDECDPITPLFCRNGVCECNDLLQHYDPNIKKCVGLVGSRCTRDKPNCVEFASCVILTEKEIAGQCICDKYSVEIANRTCIINV